MDIIRLQISTLSPQPGNLSDPCPNQRIPIQIFLHSALGISIILITILAFLTRRLYKCLDCCGGRPAIVTPINLLDDYENRWPNAFAFGAITSTIVGVFTGGDFFQFTDQVWAKVFVGILAAIEICLIYFPFFACIATEYKIPGCIIGFLYGVAWFALDVIILVDCPNPIPDVLPYANLVVQIPALLCLALMTCWFLYGFVYYIVKRCKGEKSHKEPHEICEPWQYRYVDRLINHKEKDSEEMGKKDKCREWCTKYVYDDRPTFEYSTRMVCVVFVTFMCLYQLAVAYYYVNSRAITWMATNIEAILNITGFPTNSSLVDNADVAVKMIDYSWQGVTIVSIILVIFDVLVILGHYRGHMIQLFKGDHSFLPMHLKGDSAEVIRNSLYFAGFQIAYMIWGFFLVNLVLWILALLVCFFIILPLMNGITSIVRFLAEALLIPIALNIILRLLQKVLAKVFFLQDKIKSTDDDKPLALNNRRMFHVATYFFFVANIATGAFSCLFRIVKGLVFGLCYVGRLDRCVLMSGLESKDKGYLAYLGMIALEHTHNNPTLRVFCQTLINLRQEKGSPEDGSRDETAAIENGFHGGGERRKSGSTLSEDSRTRARSRWQLCYTLINNPYLLADRRRVAPINIDNVGKGDATDGEDTDLTTTLLIAQHRQYSQLKGQMEALEKEMYGFNRHRASFGCQVSGDDISCFDLKIASKASSPAGDYEARQGEKFPRLAAPLNGVGGGEMAPPDPARYEAYDDDEEDMMREIDMRNGSVSTDQGGAGSAPGVRNRTGGKATETDSDHIELAHIRQNGKRREITPVDGFNK